MTPHPLLPASSEALFRFQVVSAVLAGIARGVPQADAVANVASVAHPTLSGVLHAVSTRSIYRWLLAYRLRGVVGLEPKRRERCDASVVLPARFLRTSC